MKKELTPFLWIIFFVVFIATPLFSEYNQEQGRINALLKEHMKAVVELKGSVDVMRTNIEKLRTKLKEADTGIGAGTLGEPNVLDSWLRTIQIKTQQIQAQTISGPTGTVRETDCKKYLDGILFRLLVIEEVYVEQLEIMRMIISGFEWQLTQDLTAELRRDLESRLNAVKSKFEIIENEIEKAEKNIIKWETEYAECTKKNSLSPEEIKYYEAKFDEIEIQIIKK